MLLYLLGLLPDGISPEKLDELWIEINKQSNTEPLKNEPIC